MTSNFEGLINQQKVAEEREVKKREKVIIFHPHNPAALVPPKGDTAEGMGKTGKERSQRSTGNEGNRDDFEEFEKYWNML
jgi:hypothetical protein